MILSTFFTDAGIPKTGLTPTIIITDITDILTPVPVVLSHSVVEIGNGLYAFNFSEYTHTHLYTVRFDGGVALDDTDRYKFGGIDTDSTILNTEIEAIKADTVSILVDSGILKVDTGILKTDVDELQVDSNALLVDTGILKADTTTIKGNETTLLADTVILKADTVIMKADLDDLQASFIAIKGAGWAADDNLKEIHDSIQYGDWIDAEKKQIRSALGIDGDKVTAVGGQLQTALTQLLFLKNIEGGKWKRDGVQMIFYAEDNTTEIARFNLFDKDGDPAGELVDAFERVRV
jgi:hypothetical protein